MKQKTITLTALTATASSLLGAEPDAFLGLTPTLDIRTRYEFRDQTPLDPSHAVTTRARVGLKTGEYAGFSAFGELEGTYALVDDFNGGGGGTSTPAVAGNTVIADPENIELNRAWVQYAGGGFTFKAGRQRITRNEHAFIGNVGWRQNEQTFDALSLAYSINGLDLSYVYSNRAQRIFGDDAASLAREFDGEFHFLDGTYKINDATIGGYIYLIDVDSVPGVGASTNVGESNTFGAFYKGHGLHLEAAWQDGTSTLVTGGDYDAFYGHIKYSKKWNGSVYSAGLEYLEEDFKTPFATVHAFNGFADAFILQRIGLNDNGGAFNGISDFYLSYVRKGLPWGLTFKGFLHYYLDDGFSNSYGYEADAVLVKKFNENLTAVLKAAYFAEDDGPGGFQDIRQVTLDFNYKF